MALLPPLGETPSFRWPDEVPQALTGAVALFVLALMRDDYDAARNDLQMSQKEAMLELRRLERFLGGPVLVAEGRQMRITALGQAAYEPAYRWCMRMRYGRVIGFFAVLLADSTMWLQDRKDRLSAMLFRKPGGS